MTTEYRMEAPGYAPAAEHEPKETLPLPLVVLLHLLPGALLMGAVLLLAPSLIERGVPFDLAFIASTLLTQAPFMVGAMLLYGRAKHGRLTLRGVVLFRRPMPLWQYAALFVPMLAFAFTVLFATMPLTDFLAERVFFWMPSYMLPSWEPRVTPAQRLILFALLAKLVFDGLANPILEEAYFRGFLLPRMGYLGAFAPAVNALLFAVAHYFQPFNWPLIFVLVLVNAYVAWWKRNIFIAMLLHCSANTIGATLFLVSFLSG